MQIGRLIQTLVIDVGGYNPREEVLRWLDFPVNDPMDKDHFLTPEKGITSIDAKSTSLNKLLEILPDSRRNTDEITHLNKAKEIDYTFTFAASKVRASVSGDVCNSPRLILKWNRLLDQTFLASVKHVNLIDELRVYMHVEMRWQ